MVGGSFVVNDPNVIFQAAVDGVGIAHLPEMMVDAAVSEGTLVSLLEDWAPRMSGLFLYYSNRRQVPAPLQAFIAFMRRHRGAVRSGDHQRNSSRPYSAWKQPVLVRETN
jgi:DNA-binding transcriptional LysR family regulator